MSIFEVCHHFWIVSYQLPDINLDVNNGVIVIWNLSRRSYVFRAAFFTLVYGMLCDMLCGMVCLL